MHRTIFLAAILVGVALSALTGCPSVDGPFPVSAYDTADAGNFVVDGVEPTRTFTLDVVLDGGWLPGTTDAQGVSTAPTMSVRLEVEPLLDEGVAPVAIRVDDATGAPLGEATLYPNEDEGFVDVDLRAAIAECVPDSLCEVALTVEVSREGETGAMLASLSASISAYAWVEDPAIATVALEAAS